MKPIRKIHFCDGSLKTKIVEILQKHYELIFTDKDPDYIFYSILGDSHIYYDGIRIFNCGENVRPDFNFCDYALGFDYIQFEDRYMRYPLYLHYVDDMHLATTKHLNITPQILEGKTRFCTFVVSNGKADSQRSLFFDLLSKYKHVNSGGKYKNNVGFPVENKHAFLKEGKFHIAFENSSTNGYTTEKLIQALASQSVPIYCGDKLASVPLNSHMGGGINPKAFVNCHSYKDFNEVLEYIKYLDTNDDAYLDILKSPSFLDSNHQEIFDTKLESFLLHIFNQPIESAYRRGFGQWRCNLEKRYKKFQTTRHKVNSLANVIKKPISSIKRLMRGF